MSNIDSVKYNSLLFTRESEEVFQVEGTLNFGSCNLLVSATNMPVYNEFTVTLGDVGTDTLMSTITFSPDLDNPGPNPDVQNAVAMKFYDMGTGEYSSVKGYNKVSGNTCPPPGTPAGVGDPLGKLDNHGVQIKTVLMQRTGGETEVTITLENIDGSTTGYRIINNVEHIIETASGPVRTWAFEIQDGNTTDTNNSFQINFDEIAWDVALPILFYAEGTDPNDVNESDALLWMQQ